MPLPTESKYAIHDTWIGCTIANLGKIEYLDENNEQTDKNNALRERFVLPFKDKYGVDINLEKIIYGKE